MPWFKRTDGILFLVLEQYDDLLIRLRKEAGWSEVADPTAVIVVEAAPAPAVVPERVAVPAQETATPPEPERATTPKPVRKPAPKRPRRSLGKGAPARAKVVSHA
jgi:hypothetical protein